MKTHLFAMDKEFGGKMLEDDFKFGSLPTCESS